MDIEERLRAASPAARIKAVLDAYEAGWSLREVAAAVGLSVGGVHRIIKEHSP